MWKIFSFLKKKKVLTVKEFDKLVDEKAKDIRKYFPISGKGIPRRSR